MSRVIQSIVMPGGWHKPEKDRSGRDLPEPVRADTYKDLIAAVAKFRADNVIPIGDVEADVENYICQNFPHMCHNVPGAEVTVTISTGNKSAFQTLTDRTIQWLDEKIDNHSIDKLVLAPEAKRRADICAKCKFNQRWNSNCGACFEAITRMSSVLRYGNDVPNGKDLYSCQILGHENRSAVWLKASELKTSHDLPQPCWCKAQ